MATPIDRKALKSELALSREAMTAYVAAVRYDLDLGAKLKRGVRANPLVWYAAASVIGFLLSKSPPLYRKVVVKGPKLPKLSSDAPEKAGKAAVVVTLLKFGLDFAKPTLLRWFKDRFLGAKPSASASA
ncbi:MAG: hypothetical protein ABI680_02570 [Chthoniobacteraceae bacterium]